MSVDWTSLGKKWNIRYIQVTPSNLNDTMGVLEGVIPSSASITESYYTDTRVQASLQFIGDGWKRQSFIRIIAELVDEDYSEELGTFLASSDDASTSNGTWTTTLELQSMLYALDAETGHKTWTVAKGANSLTAIKQMLKQCKRAYISKSANSKYLKKSRVYTSDKSYLARIYDLCTASNNRLDVDGHGRVIVSKYIRPAKKSASFTIDLESSDGMAHDGLSRSSNYLEIPTECVVYHSETNKKKTTYTYGYASNGGRVSRGKRGYVITKVVSEDDADTVPALTKLAKQKLKKASQESLEWSVTTEYMPIHAGDVGYLKNTNDPYYPEKQKVLVKERVLNLEHMTMDLTLKLASDESEDDDDE